jgi:hypothetical protein
MSWDSSREMLPHARQCRSKCRLGKPRRHSSAPHSRAACSSAWRSSSRQWYGGRGAVPGGKCPLMRDSPHSPSQEDRNRRPETRSAYRRNRERSTQRRLVPDRQEHVDLARRELAMVLFIAFDIRCLDVIEGKIPTFLIAQFGHPLEEICIQWGLSRLHTDNCCCAGAANGHAAAVPPRSVMNSRRFMVGLPPLSVASAPPGAAGDDARFTARSTCHRTAYLAT